MRMIHTVTVLNNAGNKVWGTYAESGHDGGIAAIRQLTEDFNKYWNFYHEEERGPAPAILWQSEQKITESHTLIFTSERADVITLATVEGQTATVTHEHLLFALGQIANSSPGGVKIPWNQIHSTLLANIARSLNEHCMFERPMDMRIPQWLKEEHNTPYI